MLKIICTMSEYNKINYAKFLCPIVKALGEKCRGLGTDCESCISSHIEFIIDKVCENFTGECSTGCPYIDSNISMIQEDNRNEKF